MNKLILSNIFMFLVVLSANGQESIYKRHIDTLASVRYEGRGAGTKGDTLSVRYIVSQFKGIEGVHLLAEEGVQKVNHANIKTSNVVAILKATKENNESSEHIIIGAHYDHVGMNKTNGKTIIFTGADDNASGISFLIETARELSKKQKELKKDVVFIAFGAEEKGLLGSSYYTNNPVVPLDKAKAMVNFDMLGRMINRGITIRGTGTAKESVKLLSSLSNPDSLDIIWEMRGNGPTDYSSFYRKNIPSFSFSTRHNADFHTPNDISSKINYDGMNKIHRYVMPLINTLVFDDFTLTYKISTL